MILFCFISGFISTLLISHSSQANNISLIDKPTRTFVIDYETDQFLLDGRPFRYVSGSIHYFRLPRIYWEDRLKKMRAAGLNAIETYVEWSQHEPSPGVYDFNGDLDLIHFIKLAQRLDLLVILRPGPYICAERNLGGYPAWLFTLHRNIKLRTSDPAHTTAVIKWLDVLMPKIVPLLYGNGGPIIMVQVENEYGSYFACDKNYTIWLRDVYQSYVQNAAVLFTTDGAGDGYLRCGAIPGVFITVDFAAGANISKSFAPIKRAGQMRGPLVNSEYYTGWLTHWNEKYQAVSTEAVVKSLRDILNYGNNTSVNFYMFYGGTNYGFTSGANCDSTKGYQPQLTSYDYNAPITEAGDLTEKYFAIKDVIKEYLHVPDIEVQRFTPKANYGIVKLKPKVSLLNFSNSIPAVQNKYPLTFEDINHLSGFVLYKTVLTGQLADPSMLYIPGLRDRAVVMVDEAPVGILSRFRNIFSIPLKVHAGQTLSLLVENEGHINFGTYINDTKGIVCHVLLNGQPLFFWDMIKIPLDNISKIEDIDSDSDAASFTSPPGFYSGHFQLQNNTDLRDTYLNLEGWGKGVAFINGFNLGRYWVNAGSQVTLYIPRNVFKMYPHYNKLTILELEYKNPACTAIFQDEPIINSTVPILGSYNSQCQLPCRKIMT